MIINLRKITYILSFITIILSLFFAVKYNKTRNPNIYTYGEMLFGISMILCCVLMISRLLMQILKKGKKQWKQLK